MVCCAGSRASFERRRGQLRLRRVRNIGEVIEFDTVVVLITHGFQPFLCRLQVHLHPSPGVSPPFVPLASRPARSEVSPASSIRCCNWAGGACSRCMATSDQQEADPRNKSRKRHSYEARCSTRQSAVVVVVLHDRELVLRSGIAHPDQHHLNQVVAAAGREASG